LKGTKLTDGEKAGVKALCKSLQSILKNDLESIILYGSGAREDYRPKRSDINLLIIAKKINVPVIKSVLEPTQKGRQFGIAPLLMTESDILTSTDAFPVKFISIKESYRVLAGKDVLKDLTINKEHIRLRCEQEIKNLLMRMRRYYLLNQGQGLSWYMAQCIGGFLENLRMITSLSENEIPERDKIIEIASKKFKIDAKTLQKIQTLRNQDSPLAREEEEKLFSDFMEIVTKIAQIADDLERREH
jgi:predicted nucleotidyltransferase